MSSTAITSVAPELDDGSQRALALSALGIEISNGMGASVKLQGPSVSVNDGALDVI